MGRPYGGLFLIRRAGQGTAKKVRGIYPPTRQVRGPMGVLLWEIVQFFEGHALAFDPLDVVKGELVVLCFSQ